MSVLYVLLLASLAILFEHIVERTSCLEDSVFKKAPNSQRGRLTVWAENVFGGETVAESTELVQHSCIR